MLRIDLVSCHFDTVEIPLWLRQKLIIPKLHFRRIKIVEMSLSLSNYFCSKIENLFIDAYLFTRHGQGFRDLSLLKQLLESEVGDCSVNSD